jgi:hypothetical protein
MEFAKAGNFVIVSRFRVSGARPSPHPRRSAKLERMASRDVPRLGTNACPGATEP